MADSAVDEEGGVAAGRRRVRACGAALAHGAGRASPEQVAAGQVAAARRRSRWRRGRWRRGVAGAGRWRRGAACVGLGGFRERACVSEAARVGGPACKWGGSISVAHPQSSAPQNSAISVAHLSSRAPQNCDISVAHPLNRAPQNY